MNWADGPIGTVFREPLIDRSPVRKKIHRPIIDSPEKPAWSAEQVRAILSEIPETWLAFFVCIALTTVRIGELLALTWKDIDWDNRKIRVNKALDRGVVISHTKNRKNGVRHIPEVLYQYLRGHRKISRYKESGDFVFSKFDGSASDPDHIRETVLYPALDRAGLVGQSSMK